MTPCSKISGVAAVGLAPTTSLGGQVSRNHTAPCRPCGSRKGLARKLYLAESPGRGNRHRAGTPRIRWTTAPRRHRCPRSCGSNHSRSGCCTAPVGHPACTSRCHAPDRCASPASPRKCPSNIDRRSCRDRRPRGSHRHSASLSVFVSCACASFSPPRCRSATPLRVQVRIPCSPGRAADDGGRGWQSMRASRHQNGSGSRSALSLYGSSQRSDMLRERRTSSRRGGGQGIVCSM
jgi:hypothetical protein